MKDVGSEFIIFKNLASLIEACTHSGRLIQLQWVRTQIGVTCGHSAANASSHLLKIEIEERFEAEKIGVEIRMQMTPIWMSPKPGRMMIMAPMKPTMTAIQRRRPRRHVVVECDAGVRENILDGVEVAAAAQ